MTLIELIMVIALLAILLGAVTSTFVTGLKVWDVGMLSGGVRKEASYSLRIISEELKQAITITAANLNNMTFQADLDGNGAVDTITYSWDGTAGHDLIRTQGTETMILARGAQDAKFQYYNSTNTLLGPPPAVTASAVRAIELTLQVKKENETVQYVVRIRPRGI